MNSSSVEVTWDPPVDNDKNGVIRGYQIFVQPKNVSLLSHTLKFQIHLKNNLIQLIFIRRLKYIGYFPGNHVLLSGHAIQYKQ